MHHRLAWRRVRRGRRPRSLPRAPFRRATARNSARRSPDRRQRHGAKPSVLAIFSRSEPGSVTATKRLPASSAPTACFDQIEEIGSQQLRLHRRTGFAGDDEQGARRVDRCGDRADLAGVAAVEHMQRRMTRGAAQHSADHFGAEARSAHAEQHDVLIFARLGGELAERFQVHGRAAARCQPAEPSILVAARPQCRIARPQPPRPALGAGPFKPVVDKAAATARAGWLRAR